MNFPFLPRLSRAVLMCGFAALVSQPVAVFAAEYTWNKAQKVGTTNYEWQSAANWNDGTGTLFPGAAGDIVNINIDFTGLDITITFGSSMLAKAGTLNVGDASGATSIIFGPGGNSQILTMQAISGAAAINKTSANTVTFNRGVQFTSDTVITASGGELHFNASASVTSLRGGGKLSFEGSGGVSVFKGEGGTFSTVYTGETVIQNGGTLLINNTFQANTTGAVAKVTVENTGTLGGSGVVERHTTIKNGGKLATGSGKDVITFSAGLDFQEGAHFSFGLLSDTTARRGTAFNGVDLTGGVLSIAEEVNFDLVFDGTASTVDFTSSFWDTDQEWLVFDGSSTTGSFSLGSISLDSNGQSFDAAGGAFSFKTVDGNIYLSYSVIPEPSVSLLVFGGLAGAFLLRRTVRR